MSNVFEVKKHIYFTGVVDKDIEVLDIIMEKLEINEIIVSEYDNLEGLMCQNIKNMS